MIMGMVMDVMAFYGGFLWDSVFGILYMGFSYGFLYKHFHGFLYGIFYGFLYMGFFMGLNRRSWEYHGIIME